MATEITRCDTCNGRGEVPTGHQSLYGIAYQMCDDCCGLGTVTVSDWTNLPDGWEAMEWDELEAALDAQMAAEDERIRQELFADIDAMLANERALQSEPDHIAESWRAMDDGGPAF